MVNVWRNHSSRWNSTNASSVLLTCWHMHWSVLTPLPECGKGTYYGRGIDRWHHTGGFGQSLKTFTCFVQNQYKAIFQMWRFGWNPKQWHQDMLRAEVKILKFPKVVFLQLQNKICRNKVSSGPWVQGSNQCWFWIMGQFWVCEEVLRPRLLNFWIAQTTQMMLECYESEALRDQLSTLQTCTTSAGLQEGSL
jgi:hypothetical protein